MSTAQETQGRTILAWGMLLFLLGLLTGILVPHFAVPRLGLSAHIAGVQNGLVLLIIGLLWPKLVLGPALLLLARAFSILGMYLLWLALLLCALWSAGRATPIAAAGQEASPAQEMLVQTGLVIGSLAAIAAAALMLWGLCRRRPEG
ncbi:MAG: hydroxylaminobenzene mutase [Candidatus Hydrogenedentes bacterium]|nr:hydroxylaminobenzene mutase [Candidatus Hydrogenedentota bacterium]